MRPGVAGLRAAGHDLDASSDEDVEDIWEEQDEEEIDDVLDMEDGDGDGEQLEHMLGGEEEGEEGEEEHDHGTFPLTWTSLALTD